MTNIKTFEVDAYHYDFSTWKDYFDNQKIKLRSLVTNPNWNNFFDTEELKSYFQVVEGTLFKIIKSKIIVPYPELLFHPLNICSLSEIKVVILGQDPYSNAKKISGDVVPEAMGLSFSVPLNYPTKPSSVSNIYKNLFHFKHIDKIPESGDLIPWAIQGVFMINSSLTTVLGENNVHQTLWNHFTTDLIEYINDNTSRVVFLAWGKYAHNKCINVNRSKHLVITCSHPSYHSVDKSMKGLDESNRIVTYPSFESTDCFGMANKYLKKFHKKQINWEN
jgi:uracil-DNA glycosylase